MSTAEQIVVNEQTDLTQMSDADLDKAIAAPTPEVPAAGDQPTPPGSEKPTEKPDSSTDAPAEGTPAKEGDQAADNKETPAPEGDEGEEKDPLKLLEKRVSDQEAFIQRQADEIGKLRKVAPPVDVEKIRAEIKERFFEDPIQATKDLRDLEVAEANQKRNAVLSAIPDFDDLVDEMVEVAKEEGTSDEIIAAFKRDPYRPPVDLLFNLAGQAKARKGEKAKSTEIEKVRAELAAQKKQTEEVLKRIDAAAKGGSVLTSKSGGDSGELEVVDLKAEQIADLSDAQLGELLDKRKGK